MPAQAGITLQIKNLADVLRAIEHAGLTISQAAHRGVEKTCIRVQRDAKRNAPRFESELGNSITYEITAPIESRGAAILGKVGTNVDYAEYVERGAKPSTKKPWFAPIGATLYGARWLEKHGFALKGSATGRRSTGSRSRGMTAGDRGRIPLGIMVYGRAHPFLLPAFEANKQHFADDVGAAIHAAIRAASTGGGGQR
jgi:HK97 gp10 family phage protein